MTCCISYIPNGQILGTFFTYFILNIEERFINFASLAWLCDVVIDGQGDEAINTLLANDSPMRLVVRAGFAFTESLVPCWPNSWTGLAGLWSLVPDRPQGRTRFALICCNIVLRFILGTTVSVDWVYFASLFSRIPKWSFWWTSLALGSC